MNRRGTGVSLLALATALYITGYAFHTTAPWFFAIAALVGGIGYLAIGAGDEK